MSTIHHDATLDDAKLSGTERVWLERQGRAARLLEASQRESAAARERAALKARSDDRLRRPQGPH